MDVLLDSFPYLLPFIIFFGRIIDVTLGTLRIIFVSKGEKYIAPVIGFFEVFIWIVVISEILGRANDMTSYLSYAAGYAAGNYVGILIEQRIAFGILLVRVYTQKPGKELIELLSEQGFGATKIRASGSLGDVCVIETVVERKMLKRVDSILGQFDPGVFYVTEDIRTRKHGIFPKNRALSARWRPGK